MKNLRIICIDGPYGVGKTTIANRIRDMARKEKITIIDADLYYRDFSRKYPKVTLFFGTRPDNNKPFIKELGDYIDLELRHTANILMVVMAFTDNASIEGIIDRFREKQYKVAHVVLKASRETIIRRIEEDNNRDKEFAKQWLDFQHNFLENKSDPDTIRIDADSNDIDAIAGKIIATLGL